MFKQLLWLGLWLFVLGCNSESSYGISSNKIYPNLSASNSEKDNYSYAQQNEAVIKHLDLDIEVNFANKKIVGKASFQIDNKTGADKIYFDTKHLDIEKVTLGSANDKTNFALVGYEEHLGRKLEIEIKPNTKMVTVFYSTRPEAMALQWLSAEQTAGKSNPYLFTQSEPTYARSWIPMQDSPGIRITYNARVKVPKNLMAVMSASNSQKRNENGEYSFEMEYPIPGYLIAMAVGDLVFQPLGERTGVYAEKEIIDAAAYEFGEMEEMLGIVEGLYGAYSWDRYDLIVLPPSFPFGGMENPMLTFITPTLIAGDRSLVSVVAHELAHSWSGNLVTNATWNDFWINEGFTVYLERRIMEALYGKSYTEMLALLGYQDLEYTISLMGQDSPDTHLKLQLNGRDPDEALTDIAYEKGALFLKTAEEAVGRERWDEFLKTYFKRFSFQSMSSEQFVNYFNENLVNGDSTLAAKIKIEKWVFGPGIPNNHPTIKSPRFITVDEEITKWNDGKIAGQLKVENWTTHEWLHFLRHLPESISAQKMDELDNAFSLSKSGNSEILCAWFTHVIKNEYLSSYDELEGFLVKVGRRKFLAPLYKELSRTEKNKMRALAIYKKARSNYHRIATVTIDAILGWEDTRYLYHD